MQEGMKACEESAKWAAAPQQIPTKTHDLAEDMLAFPDMSKQEQRKFTLSEVARCDGVDGRPLYIIVDDCVYDITKFAQLHPAGPEPLKEHAGQDATLAMKTSGMSPKVMDIYIKRFQVGTIIESEKDNSTVQENLNDSINSRL